MFDRLNTSASATTTRILRVWSAADAGALDAGRRWYPEGLALLTEWAEAYGTTVEHAAAVTAHLSPRTPWDRNILAAEAVIAGAPLPPGVIGAHLARARAALDSSDPLGTLNGPKTRRFAANFLGDHDQVTVDVWALRVALGRRDNLDRVIGWSGAYGAIECCYQRAAAKVGVSPATMQATTWVVARNGRTGLTTAA